MDLINVGQLQTSRMPPDEEKIEACKSCGMFHRNNLAPSPPCFISFFLLMFTPLALSIFEFTDLLIGIALVLVPRYWDGGQLSLLGFIKQYLLPFFFFCVASLILYI